MRIASALSVERQTRPLTRQLTASVSSGRMMTLQSKSRTFSFCDTVFIVACRCRVLDAVITRSLYVISFSEFSGFGMHLHRSLFMYYTFIYVAIQLYLLTVCAMNCYGVYYLLLVVIAWHISNRHRYCTICSTKFTLSSIQGVYCFRLHHANLSLLSHSIP